MRSNDNRRMSVARSAMGDGASCFSASFARMKRSIALRSISTPESAANAALATGGLGFVIGCQAQWSSRGSRTASSSSSASWPGHGSPASIHAARAATSSEVSRSPSGGIICSGFVVLTRRMSSLASALPATAAGPKSPPRRIAARESSRRCDSCPSAPWHSAQRARIKACAAECASSPRAAAGNRSQAATAGDTRNKARRFSIGTLREKCAGGPNFRTAGFLPGTKSAAAGA